MPDLVLAAPLVAVVPGVYARLACARMPQLVAWPLPLELPPFDVRLLWHVAGEGEPALDWLRERVVALFRRR